MRHFLSAKHRPARVEMCLARMLQQPETSGLRRLSETVLSRFRAPSLRFLLQEWRPEEAELTSSGTAAACCYFWKQGAPELFLRSFPNPRSRSLGARKTGDHGPMGRMDGVAASAPSGGAQEQTCRWPCALPFHSREVTKSSCCLLRNLCFWSGFLILTVLTAPGGPHRCSSDCGQRTGRLLSSPLRFSF